MTTRLRLAAFVFVLTALVPVVASALTTGTAKLQSVVPNARPSSSGCIAGPIPVGPIDNWYLEQGKTYIITIENAVDCANGGTDATIFVEIRSTSSGSVFVIATKGAPGVYSFSFTMPSNACGPFQVIYCVGCITDPQGMIAGKADGSGGEADLFPAQFFNNCTFYSPVYCSTAAPKGTWGSVKALYR